MIGAIAGDMIGSPYEVSPIKHKNISMFVSAFTDDTVMTVAVANAILNDLDYADSLKDLAQKYYDLPYGRAFKKWIWTWENQPYNSFGNGSAMRVSPVGFAFDTEDAVLHEAKRSAGVTHNHPEGIKGAQATALAIYMARKGADKDTIRAETAERFRYDMNRTVEEIRPNYRFDISCQHSVPESIIAFLDSISWEDAIRNAISLGGDADTMACITGGIAQAFYKKIPESVTIQVVEKLPSDLAKQTHLFNQKFGCIF